ncbi:DUF4880 domain-containing protein [Janthinobacterium sp. LB2P70]|uniref:DUF4880 domain-containing protein n=1 Tax=Janthinobacterium sp. LB2P70 TaxID=3424197 RepID=UPI003F2761F4
MESAAAPAAIREEVQQQAAEWLTMLMSGEMDSAQQAAWQRWREADPEHERAWRHIEAVSQRFNGLHRGAAAQALAGTQQKAVNGKRRQLLAWRPAAACWPRRRMPGMACASCVPTTARPRASGVRWCWTMAVCSA